VLVTATDGLPTTLTLRGRHGPLSVSIDASFSGYHDGVISGAGCNHTHVDHAVLLVGYGVDTSVSPWMPYWKLKKHAAARCPPKMAPPSAT
jgi:hypothetical protein